MIGPTGLLPAHVSVRTTSDKYSVMSGNKNRYSAYTRPTTTKAECRHVRHGVNDGARFCMIIV